MHWTIKNRSTLESAEFAVTADSVSFITGNQAVATAVADILQRGIPQKYSAHAPPGARAIGIRTIPALGHATTDPLEERLRDLGFIVVRHTSPQEKERPNMPRHLDEMTVKHILWDRFHMATGIELDADGYLPEGQQHLNLLPKVPFEAVNKDYCGGSGCEWKTKFRAVHSSAALAANNFGRWRLQPEGLSILGHQGFRTVKLEGQVPTGLGGTPPNLDALLVGPDVVIGVESKFLEPLHAKKPAFSASYDRDALPFEPQWKSLYEQARDSGPSHFDVAQIVKHYLGLRHNFTDNRAIILLYAYWEPTNAREVTQYVAHKEQVEAAARIVAQRVDGKPSQVTFVAKPYHELWSEWLAIPDMRAHAVALCDRYNLAV